MRDRRFEVLFISLALVACRGGGGGQLVDCGNNDPFTATGDMAVGRRDYTAVLLRNASLTARARLRARIQVAGRSGFRGTATDCRSNPRRGPSEWRGA